MIRQHLAAAGLLVALLVVAPAKASVICTHSTKYRFDGYWEAFDGRSESFHALTISLQDKSGSLIMASADGNPWVGKVDSMLEDEGLLLMTFKSSSTLMSTLSMGVHMNSCGDGDLLFVKIKNEDGSNSSTFDGLIFHRGKGSVQNILYSAQKKVDEAIRQQE